MARQPRIEFDNAWYHIMNRGAGRKRIFHDDDDYSRFLELLGETTDLFGIEIHAYSLMNNHYHLLVHTPNAGISRTMRHLGAEYTQYHNHKYKTDGPLFRGRFKSVLAERDTYLSRLVRYIHLNPVQAGLCKTPQQHPWTSHLAYLDKKSRPRWLTIADVLSDFSQRQNSAARRFHDYVITGNSPDFVEIIEGKRRARILGSVGFCDWAKDNLLDTVAREKKLLLTRKRKRPELSPKRILSYVATEYQIAPEEIVKHDGSRFNAPKSMAMYLMQTAAGLTHAQIATALAMMPQAVSKQLQRLKKIQTTNKEWSARAHFTIGIECGF